MVFCNVVEYGPSGTVRLSSRQVCKQLVASAMAPTGQSRSLPLARERLEASGSETPGTEMHMWTGSNEAGSVPVPGGQRDNTSEGGRG